MDALRHAWGVQAHLPYLADMQALLSAFYSSEFGPNALPGPLTGVASVLTAHTAQAFYRRWRMRGVMLEDSSRIDADWIVNCTGAWAPALCAKVGIDVPVKPLPIMAYYFETRREVDPFGVTIDLDRISFRPEGRGFISINHRPELSGTFCWEPVAELFEDHNWPRLAHRVPAFEALKVMQSYCCHYAMNYFDGNVLLGAWPGKPDNFLRRCGGILPAVQRQHPGIDLVAVCVARRYENTMQTHDAGNVFTRARYIEHAQATKTKTDRCKLVCIHFRLLAEAANCSEKARL